MESIVTPLFFLSCIPGVNVSFPLVEVKGRLPSFYLLCNVCLATPEQWQEVTTSLSHSFLDLCSLRMEKWSSPKISDREDERKSWRCGSHLRMRKCFYYKSLLMAQMRLHRKRYRFCPEYFEKPPKHLADISAIFITVYTIIFLLLRGGRRGEGMDGHVERTRRFSLAGAAGNKDSGARS